MLSELSVGVEFFNMVLSRRGEVLPDVLAPSWGVLTPMDCVYFRTFTSGLLELFSKSGLDTRVRNLGLVGFEISALTSSDGPGEGGSGSSGRDRRGEFT